MLGDSLAIIASFLFAYLIRTHLDSRPYYFVSDPLRFTLSVAFMVPAWLVILAVLGLYNKKNLSRSLKMAGALAPFYGFRDWYYVYYYLRFLR